MAKALSVIDHKNGARIAELGGRLINGIRAAIPDVRFNGPQGNRRLPNNVNISIPGTDSESLLLELDRHGIRAGSGSACTAHSVEPSHVLRAIRTPRRYLSGVLRFSLGRATTRADIDRVVRVLPAVVARVRSRRSGGGRIS